MDEQKTNPSLSPGRKVGQIRTKPPKSRSTSISNTQIGNFCNFAVATHAIHDPNALYLVSPRTRKFSLILSRRFFVFKRFSVVVFFVILEGTFLGTLSIAFVVLIAITQLPGPVMIPHPECLPQ